jgi:hypothetical protein
VPGRRVRAGLHGFTLRDTHAMSDLSELGARILARGVVSGPPREPWERGTPYPLALDVNGRHGAVSFAMLDPYPYIARGWWCAASIWANGPRGWGDVGGDHDNLTTQMPFERPTRAENSTVGWCDWHSNGGAAGWGPQDPDPWRHTFFGIAPVSTARLTVTDQTGAERDLRSRRGTGRTSPWSAGCTPR